MIRTLLLLVVRALVETAVVFLAVAAVLLVLGWRLGRRVVTPSDGRLERISARAVQLLSLVPKQAEAEEVER